MADLISRRHMLARLSASLLLATRVPVIAQSRVPIVVYKDPSCGCCRKWVDHMTANGFIATVIETDMRKIKTLHRVPTALESCHTTLVGGYVIEGHVPGSDVKRLLAAKSGTTIGLAIPGMPVSAPGMDLLPFQPYNVMSFDSSGRTVVFAKHEGP